MEPKSAPSRIERVSTHMIGGQRRSHAVMADNVAGDCMIQTDGDLTRFIEARSPKPSLRRIAQLRLSLEDRLQAPDRHYSSEKRIRVWLVAVPRGGAPPSREEILLRIEPLVFRRRAIAETCLQGPAVSALDQSAEHAPSSSGLFSRPCAMRVEWADASIGADSLP